MLYKKESLSPSMSSNSKKGKAMDAGVLQGVRLLHLREVTVSPFSLIRGISVSNVVYGLDPEVAMQ